MDALPPIIEFFSAAIQNPHASAVQIHRQKTSIPRFFATQRRNGGRRNPAEENLDTPRHPQQREGSPDHGTGRKRYVRHHNAARRGHLLLQDDFDHLLLDEPEEVPFRHADLRDHVEEL